MPYAKSFPAAYKLTHRPSGYFYVGSSVCHRKRTNEHKTHLNRGKHTNRKLQDIFTSWDDMEVEVFRAVDIEDARRLEQTLIDKYIDDPLCCNIGRSSTNPLLGVITREMVIANGRKASQRRIGTKLSAETRARMSASHTGLTRGDDDRMKISLGKAKGVSIEGVEYGSAYQAAITLGIPVRTVRTRLYADSRKFKDWFFIE